MLGKIEISRVRLTVPVLATALVLAAGAAGAEEPRAQQPSAGPESTPADVETGSPPDAGSRPVPTAFRVSIDPQTGTLVPVKHHGLEMSPELRRALGTSDDGLFEIVLPSGARLVRLDGRFMSASVATVGEDGKVTVGYGLTPSAVTPDGDGDASATADGSPDEGSTDDDQ